MCMCRKQAMFVPCSQDNLGFSVASFFWKCSLMTLRDAGRAGHISSSRHPIKENNCHPTSFFTSSFFTSSFWVSFCSSSPGAIFQLYIYAYLCLHIYGWYCLQQAFCVLYTCTEHFWNHESMLTAI